MAQNTCVYGCRLVLYQFKFNISSLSRFMKPRMGIIDGFLLQPRNFLSKKSPFWRKIDLFCGCFCPKHMCVVADQDYTIPMSTLVDKEGHHGSFSGPTSPFSTKPTTIFEENSEVSGLFWPKKYVCMVVIWYYTSLNSTLVQCQGSWSRGWKS